jgi:hypothetical protein
MMNKYTILSLVVIAAFNASASTESVIPVETKEKVAVVAAVINAVEAQLEDVENVLEEIITEVAE